MRRRSASGPYRDPPWIPAALPRGSRAVRPGNRLREQINVQYPARFDPASCVAEAAEPVPADPSWLVRYGGEPGVFQAFDEPRVVPSPRS